MHLSVTEFSRLWWQSANSVGLTSPWMLPVLAVQVTEFFKQHRATPAAFVQHNGESCHRVFSQLLGTYIEGEGASSYPAYC